VHGVIEWVRQASVDRSLISIVKRVMWELKLDIALILFAAAIAVYMDVILGVAGLGSAARLGLHSGARVAGWGRAFQGLLLSVDDMAHVARVAFMKKSHGQPLSPAEEHALYPWREPGWGDWFALGLGAVCVVMVAVAPWLIGMSYGEIAGIFSVEFHPFPDRAD